MKDAFRIMKQGSNRSGKWPLEEALRSIHEALFKHTPNVLCVQEMGDHVTGFDDVTLGAHPTATNELDAVQAF